MTAGADIQAVIFDFGGVLDVPADLAAEHAQRSQLAADLGLEVDEMWRRFYKAETWKQARIGQISDAEFWDRSLSPFAITDRADQAAFVQRLFAHKEIVPAMRGLLAELRARVRLAIISNATDSLETGLTTRFQIAHHFDLIINSARVKRAKPEPEIFHLALERLSLQPEQTAFIDDQPHNVDAASRLGIHAILFTDVASLRARLYELGVLEDSS